MSTEEQIAHELRQRQAGASVKKLILYAEHKQKVHDIDNPIYHSREAKLLRKELLDGSISPELLDLSGDEIAQVIYECLTSQ